MNKLYVQGTLTRDVELRYSAGDDPKAVGRTGLAVRKYSSKSNEESTAEFFNIVAFGRMAEHLEKYFKKGSKILIGGSIQTGSYTNKDGVKVYTVDLVCEEAYFVDSPGSLNRVLLYGNLTRDIELKGTETKVGKTAIAVKRWVKNGEDKTDFINLVAFKDDAVNMSKFFSKGSRVIVEGRIRNNVYTDTEGKKHNNVEVVVDGFSFAGKKESGDNAAPETAGSLPEGFLEIPDGFDEEMPFFD